MAAGLLGGIDFYADTISIKNNTTLVDERGISHGLSQDQNISIDQARTQLLSDPAGLKEVRVDVTLDLTTLAAKFKNICTIPAGSKVKVAIAQVLTTVVAGGTTVKLGIGPNAGTTDLLGLAAALTKNTQIGAVPADAASLIATSTAIDLCGVTSAGTALGDTNISAGLVRCIIVYDTPAVLANV